MKEAPKVFGPILAMVLVAIVLQGSLLAQDEAQAPSQKTKDAVDKFSETPALLGKKLQGLSDAAKAKLKQVFGTKSRDDANSGSADLIPAKVKSESDTARFSQAGTRDPFRPLNLKTKTSSQPRENLSPLETYELGQLKIVGIVWDIKEPRAMIEDTAGLGYIVKVGTPIGNSGGRVKEIDKNQIVVEESYEDFSGVKKKRDVRLKLATESPE